MRRVRTTVPLAFPLALVLATGVLGTFFDRATEIYFINSLVSVSMVVALYVFVGNSGVLSFGHMSFVAVGAWTAGVLSVPVEEKPATMPSLFGFLGESTVGNIPSLLLAAIVAVMLTVQQPLVTSTFALRETIVVLAGVVVGGMNRLLSATLGGFAIGYASGLLGGALPTEQSQYLPSFLFGLVILTLLVRPAGLFTRGGGPVERV